MPLRKVIDTHEYPLTEAKDRFSALTTEANATGTPFVVLKGGKPWVEVRPLRVDGAECRSDRIRITPTHRTVEIADLDNLFDGFDGSYKPVEDGLATPAGSEEL